MDYYETTFINTFNTLVPNGYNVMAGGNVNKRCSTETRELISEQKRFMYVSDEDRQKIEKSMEDLGINEIPQGIVYQHNTNLEDYKEGFVVSIDDGMKKSFTIGSMSLTEKLRLALEYQEYYKNQDIENLRRMDDDMEERTRQRLSQTKRFQYISEDDLINVMGSMNDVGIDMLPKGIRYTHNKNRKNFEGFNVVVNNNKSKTFCSAKTLTDNLRLALEYQDYFLKNDVENMERMDRDTKNRHTQRTKSAWYSQEAWDALKELDLHILDVPLDVYFRSVPSPEFYVVENKKKILFTQDSCVATLRKCLEYSNSKNHDIQRGSV